MEGQTHSTKISGNFPEPRQWDSSTTGLGKQAPSVSCSIHQTTGLLHILLLLAMDKGTGITPPNDSGFCSLAPLVEELRSHLGEGLINDLWFLLLGRRKSCRQAAGSPYREAGPALRALCSTRQVPGSSDQCRTRAHNVTSWPQPSFRPFWVPSPNPFLNDLSFTSKESITADRNRTECPGPQITQLKACNTNVS